MEAQLFDALVEWRDARAAFLQCAGDVLHTEDDYIPQDVCRRFTDAEEKLAEVAKGLSPHSGPETDFPYLEKRV
jgi:hypothetical protein